MLCIVGENTDPYFNLASEEYLLKNFTEDIFLLYRNEPSIIVGKHQNTIAEINYRYVLEKNIKVVRRISGGGTVFHDLGNLNFSFINTGKPGFLVDYRKYLLPMVEAMNTLGISASISERNDLYIRGKKITGTASHVYKNRVMHHGTLLFSSEMSDLSNALTNNSGTYTDRAVKSIRSKVTNIKNHLGQDMDVLQFRDVIIKHILEYFPAAELYKFSDHDIREINKLRITKFIDWEWNFGYSPRYHFNKKISTGAGNLEIHMNVVKGVIKEIRFTGDFVTARDLKGLEDAIIGTIHDPPAIRRCLQDIDVSEYIQALEKEELVAGMF